MRHRRFLLRLFWRRKNCWIDLARVLGDLSNWHGKLLPEWRDLIARIRRVSDILTPVGINLSPPESR